jgi:hypothetical protein
MAADFLKANHDPRQSNSVNFFTLAELASLKVLAENAAEITPTEKDGPRAIPTAQYVLFTEVRKRAGHARVPTYLADAELIRPSVYTFAQAGTCRAGRAEMGEGLLDFVVELACLIGHEVGWDEVPPAQNKSPIAMNLRRYETAYHEIPSYFTSRKA